MALDQNVRFTIDLIDKRISKLQQTKELLLSEFGDNSSAASPPPSNRPSLSPDPPSGTRKQQVKAFLVEHGPSSRAKIVEVTGIPLGTVAYVLNDKDMFKGGKNGLWTVKSKDHDQPSFGIGA